MENHSDTSRSTEELELISAEVERVQNSAIGVLETDWAMTLGSAPVAIAILGRCILLSSTPGAVTLALSDNKISRKLESKYLRVNLIDISHFGEKAFMEAEVGMAKINILSRDLGRNMDNLMKLLSLPSTPMSKSFIDIQLKALENKASACEEEATRIAKIFEQWHEKTHLLHLAVQEDAVVNEVAQDNAREKLDLQRKRVKESQTAKDIAERRLDFQRYKVLQTMGRRDQMETEMKSETGTIVGAGIGLAAAANPWIGLGLAAVTVFGIWAVEADYQNAEHEHESKWRSLKQAQVQQELAELEVANLVEKGQSLGKIAHVLKHAIENLQELQNEIRSLYLFFAKIVGFVDVLMKLYRGEFSEYAKAMQSNELPDAASLAMLDQMMRPVATSIKCQFSVMHHVASAYHTISNKHVMPGFTELRALGLTSTSLTERDIAEKKQRLITYQEQGAASVRTIAQDAQKALKTNINSITVEAMKGIAIS